MSKINRVIGASEMRKAAIVTAIILIITEVKINGQWSTNPNENLEVNPWGVFVTACSDGEGGAYIGWKNFDYYYTRAYLQYVDKYGYVQWDEPLMILDKGDLQYEPFLIEDGEGNCIVTVAVSNIIEILPGGTKLLDYTNYIQKINKNGTLLWDTNAVMLTLNDRDQYTPSIVTDQKGGALFCWYEAIINEEENSFARYYTQHIQ
ncbi:MAG: hypothetical protein K9J16_14755, partial [Melioribacteraceae bacterium]|nr:hypothetical protein [Melioribacteraceae bacterium]